MSNETDDQGEIQTREDLGHEDLGANLAFVKALVSEGGQAQVSGGAIFLTAGLCYGVQCFLQWTEAMGWVPWEPYGMIFAIAPTVVFLAILSIIIWKERKQGPKGVATRALNAAFSSAGLANLFMVAVFGYVAFFLEKSLLIWMLYPVVVCAFQGAVWYTAYMIRRKLWLAGVSAGWFITTLALGLLIKSPHYVLVLAIALTVLMGGSGYAMMHLAKKNA